MFENPRRGRQARNFTTNVPKILVLKSSSEQIFSRKLPLGTPESLSIQPYQKFANIWRIERVGISAIKFEVERIHFLSDVFVAVAIVVA